MTQGEVLDAFAAYCRGELDDVEVLEQTPSRLSLRWRRERELRRAARRVPLLRPTRRRKGRCCCWARSARRRSSVSSTMRPSAPRVAVLDLARLEKIAAVRSSVFVYLEWFLRDEYGVKILPESTFTAGLVGRGIISLGMG